MSEPKTSPLKLKRGCTRKRYERKVFFNIPDEIRVKIQRVVVHILGFQDETVLTRDIDLYLKRGVDPNHGVHAQIFYVDVINGN